MNTKIVSAIALKLFGIYVAIALVLALPTIAGTVVAMQRQPGLIFSLLFPIAIAVITILVGLLLFKLLWKLGNGVLREAAKDEESVWKTDADTLELVLLKLLGVYLVVLAIVESPKLATSLWAKSHIPSGIGLEDYAWLISIVLQFVIGLRLISSFNKWLMVVRNLGRNR